jgi:hypothetical protein
MHVVAFDCCFSVSPFGTFQAFTIDFGHWGRTDDLNFTYLFSMLHISPRQKKSSNLFVKLRSDLRINPHAGTVHAGVSHQSEIASNYPPHNRNPTPHTLFGCCQTQPFTLRELNLFRLLNQTDPTLWFVG